MRGRKTAVPGAFDLQRVPVSEAPLGEFAYFLAAGWLRREAGPDATEAGSARNRRELVKR